MDAALEDRVLLWVAEGFRRDKSGSGASIHFLLLRMAMESREESADLSQSIELSLQEFDRANVLRILTKLYQRSLISFHDSTGAAVPFEPEKMKLSDKIRGSQLANVVVVLTEEGVLHATKLLQGAR